MTMNRTKNNDKTQPRNSETPQPADQSRSTVVSPIPDSKGKATSSPWIKKYEMGSGKDKINVRIFKEPAPEPVMEPENSHTE